MNIGFDGKRALFNRSGLGNYSRNVVNALARFYPEHNYYLYAPIGSASFSCSLESSIRIRYPSTPLFGKIWRSFLVSRSLVKDNIKLYHGLSNEIPFTLHKTGIASVVTIHDLIFMTMPDLYKPADRLIYHKKTEYICRYAHRIIAASQQTKNDLLKFFPAAEKKTDVVYQPVARYFHERWAPQKIEALKKKYDLPQSYLLTVGTIERRKNLLRIIQAIHDHKIILPLVVIGQATPYLKTVTEYISRHHMHNRIIFLHHIQDNELPGFYQAASLFLYLSLYEGFGIPVLEALTSGVPVLASAGGCLEETGGNAACYTDAANPEAIGSSIFEILSDSERIKKMIALGITHAARFSEQRIATDLNNIYHHTVNTYAG